MEGIVNSTDSNDCDIDDVVDRFTLLLHDTSCNIFGKTYYTKHDPKYTESPWFNEVCLRRKIEFKALLTLYNNNRSEENHRCMLVAKRSYVNTIKRAKRHYYLKRRNNLKDLAKRSPSKIWKDTKKQNSTSNDETISLDEFYNHFSSLSQMSENDSLHLYASNNIYVEELDKHIPESEILYAVNGLRREKASAIDELVNEIFIDGKYVLTPFLGNISNYIFENNEYPKTWTKGIIFPIPKRAIQLMYYYRG